jgi:hypothetical protein
LFRASGSIYRTRGTAGTNPLKKRDVGMVIGLLRKKQPGVGIVETKQDFIAHIRSANETLDEKSKDLCRLSMQLQEYSRALKQKSDEIKLRLQSCVNVRRAA